MTGCGWVSGQRTLAVWENHPPAWVVLIVGLLFAASWLAPFRDLSLPGWAGALFVGGFVGAAITSSTGPSWLFVVFAMVTAAPVVDNLGRRARRRKQAGAPPPE